MGPVAPGWRSVLKPLRFWAQERAAETTEYIGVGAVMLALLLAVGSFMSSSGGRQIGEALVRTLTCLISFKTDCPASPEVAQVPPPVVVPPETDGDPVEQILGPPLAIPELARQLVAPEEVPPSQGAAPVTGPLGGLPLSRNPEGSFNFFGEYTGECLEPPPPPTPTTAPSTPEPAEPGEAAPTPERQRPGIQERAARSMVSVEQSGSVVC